MPSGKDGLKCTGTYSGNTAWDPWAGTNLPADEPPVVTVSQARNLTDQGVQVNWSRFTPSLVNGHGLPNPGQTFGTAVFQVSLFECKGTNPDFTSLDTVKSDCNIFDPVGTKTTTTPPNGELGITADSAAPPASALQNQVATGPYSAFWGYQDFLSRVGGPSKQSALPVATPAPASDCRSGQPNSAAHPCLFNGGDPNTWTGQADFHVEAPTPRAQGGFFDGSCGPSSPCSLVVAPNWGGVPANGTTGPNSNVYEGPNATSTCTTHNAVASAQNHFLTDLSGSLAFGAAFGQSDNPGTNGTPATLTGASRACWAADRIVIPLNFGPTPANCPNKTPQFLAAGSPMMQLQLYQWTTGWCNGPGALAVQYAANSESSTRIDFLAGGQAGGATTDMALVTLPADPTAQQGSSRKFTYAPLANSGTGIAFAEDDAATGVPINRMVLSPRLLAKLTSQSYTLQYGCTPFGLPGQPPPGQDAQPGQFCDPAVLKNPFSLFDDPEFQRLNTDCRPVGQPAGYTCGDTTTHLADSAQGLVAYSDLPPDLGSDQVWVGSFLPTALLGESDMTYDLTGLVAADSDATDFLRGKIDPWGMHVNNNYLGVSYPVQNFSVLDDGWTNPNPTPCPGTGPQGCNNDSYSNGTMFNSWTFQQDLNTIAQDLATNQPTALAPTVTCPFVDTGGCQDINQLKNGSLAPQPETERSLLSVLDLGNIANYQFPAAEILNASGTPVAPSQATVEAAVKDMKTNPDGITQYYDFATKDKNAYPLSMTDYAMVPTCGLSKSEASAIAEFLTRAATTGQAQGSLPGQLGQGYYPLTAAQKAQTLKAAGEVKAQDCKSPPLDKTISGHTGVDTTSATGGPGSGMGAPGTGLPGTGLPGTGTNASAKNPATGAKPGSPAGTGASGAPIGKAQTAAFGQKSPDSPLTGILLLIAMIIGGLAMVGGPAAWAVTATGKWPVVARYTRPVWAWAQPAWARVRANRIWRP